jgi:hypothetical protein
MEGIIFQTVFHWLKSTNVDHLKVEICSVILHIRGATQKFREFKRGAKTGCHIPFRR